MAANPGINRYLNNHYEGMSQEQLIHTLYKAALERLNLAKEGIKENNVQKRGENLSKAIAIVSELNASVDATMTDESTVFLRGLYAAILAELPKVSLTNDVTILERSHGYLSKLKEIWETQVMAADNSSQTMPSPRQKVSANYPGNRANQSSFTAFSV
jgi:flagellar protein FliS